MWENFRDGGVLIVKLKKTDYSNIDKLWQELVVAALGEYFGEPTIVGVGVGTRPKHTFLSIWLSSPVESIKLSVMKSVKRLLKVPATALEYKKHKLSMADQSTYRNTQKLSKKSQQSGNRSRSTSKRSQKHSQKKKHQHQQQQQTKIPSSDDAKKNGTTEK